MRAALSNERPLRGLGRHLLRAAPRHETTGLRQSRRLEGQLCRDVERRCFSEVILALPTGTAAHEVHLGSVTKTITRFQRDQQRGRYPFKLALFGHDATREEERVLDERTSGGSLRNWILKHLETTDDEQPPTLTRLPKHSRQALIIIAHANDSGSLSPEVSTRLNKHPKRQLVWLDLDEGTFRIGNRPSPVADEPEVAQ